MGVSLGGSWRRGGAVGAAAYKQAGVVGPVK